MSGIEVASGRKVVDASGEWNGEVELVHKLENPGELAEIDKPLIFLAKHSMLLQSFLQISKISKSRYNDFSTRKLVLAVNARFAPLMPKIDHVDPLPLDLHERIDQIRGNRVLVAKERMGKVVGFITRGESMPSVVKGPGFIKNAVESVKNGNDLLIYPSGFTSFSGKIDLRWHSGISFILKGLGDARDKAGLVFVRGTNLNKVGVIPAVSELDKEIDFENDGCRKIAARLQGIYTDFCTKPD